MRFSSLGLMLLLVACSGGDPAADAGAGDGGLADAAQADLGGTPAPPDAGFGGGLGARCLRHTDCDDPSHKCLIGAHPNTRLRCSQTCVRDEQCFPFAEGASLTREEVACELPQNFQTTRFWCVQTPPPVPDGGPNQDASASGDSGAAGDLGPVPDTGAGQAPGSRCDRDDQCRHGRCRRGFSGDSFCTVPCVDEAGCQEFRTNSALDLAHSACIDQDGERLCREVAALPRPGWDAVLRRGLNEVRARVILTENRGLRIRDFYYDGRRHGQEVYIAVSLGAVTVDNVILVSMNLRCRGGICGEGHPCALTVGTCNNADFELVLPEGLGYDQFDRVSIVGMPQGLAWSEAEFTP
jgi:hypothetical protein